MVRKTVCFIVHLFSLLIFSQADAAESPRYYPAIGKGTIIEPAPAEKPKAIKVRHKKSLDESAGAANVVNINSATAEEIDAVLIGIGPAKARAIVDYRERNGQFKSISDLTNVKGIGESTLLKNKARISI